MTSDFITLARIRQETCSRAEAADLLNLHPDSVTHALTDGLAGAVLRWGGRGKRMVFSRPLVLRWQRARTCHVDPRGGPCRVCRSVLEDAKCAGDHLLVARHGIDQACDDRDPDTEEPACWAPERLGQPCRPV